MHFSFCEICLLLLTTSNVIEAQNWKNAALGQRCDISSMYQGDGFTNDCSCAINNNTGTTYETGNCIHTAVGTTQQWWYVDLGQDYTIWKFTVYARSGQVVRMENVNVLVDLANIFTFTGSEDLITTITSRLPRKGRHVNITIAGNEWRNVILNICEVQVWVCNTGFYGPNCVMCQSCVNRPCTAMDYSDNCPTDRNECQEQPLVCNPGTCINTIGSYTCQCPSGYRGTTNCQDINECQEQPSVCNPGTCINKPGSYTCQCPVGYTGTINCQDTDECQRQLNPCTPGSCTNNLGSYTCQCTAGYSGTTNCQDNDECTSNPCVNGACLNFPGYYTCNCTTGYTGTRCDQDLDECEPTPCSNGTCTNNPGSYTCACIPGYTGQTCDQDIDECQRPPYPCSPGNCSNTVGSYTCHCPTGYTGTSNCSEVPGASASHNLAGPIAGGLSAVVVLLAVTGLIGVCCWKRRTSRSRSTADQEQKNGSSGHDGPEKSDGRTIEPTANTKQLKPDGQVPSVYEIVFDNIYNQLHPYSNDLTPERDAYTGLRFQRK